MLLSCVKRCVPLDEYDATTVEETRETMEEENARSDYNTSATTSRGSVYIICMCLYTCMYACVYSV